jgi:hypothetical protein
MVTKLSEHSLRRRRSATSFPRRNLFLRHSFNHHLPPRRPQLASIPRPWEECPSVHLPRAYPVVSRRQDEVLRHTTPASRPLELLPEVLSLYPQHHLAYLRDRRNHRPDIPTQPISTLEASDHHLDLLRKVTQLLLHLVSLRLLQAPVLLLELLHLVSCLLQASNHPLDSAGDRPLHNHHIVLFMQKIPSVSSRLDRVQDMD